MTQCPIHTRPAAGSITSVSAVTVVARDVKIRQKTLKLLFATPSCVRRERSFSLAVECVRTSEAVNLSMRFGFPAVAGTVWFIPYKALVTSSISSDCAHEGGACTARGSRSVPAIQTSTRGRSWAAQFSSVDRTCTSAGSSGRSSAGDGDRSTTSSSTTRSTRRGRSAISKTEGTNDEAMYRLNLHERFAACILAAFARLARPLSRELFGTYHASMLRLLMLYSSTG